RTSISRQGDELTMESFLEFLSFENPNVRFVTAGMLLLGISSGVTGVFAFLRKRTLVGDAVAHSVLPGVCLAFMLTGTKNFAALLTGAALTGWLSLVMIDVITSKSRIPADAAIGLVLSVFFGAGILLLTSIQKSGVAAQAGLDKFLFGNAASLIQSDIITFGILCLAILVVVWLLYKEFKVISFDRDYARVIGLPVRPLETVMATLTVLSITVGIQAVGVVLMAAMLITPAAAAHYWTNDLRKMLGFASLVGALAGFAGAYISYTAPGMPTGPWVIVVVSVMAFASMLLAPKGWLTQMLYIRRNRRKILQENILKLFYHLAEQEHDFEKPRNSGELLSRRKIPQNDLQSGIKALRKKRMLQPEGAGWRLTDAGRKEAQRIVRIHRLWELYLNTYLKIAPDHVHEDAEAIEHVITPEIEARLEKLLQHPGTDPHRKDIPYVQ
ncbi:MAG TPA: iron chelate uptake ABC transporter family permease subunit, partial [Chitinophagales bacterium]|nr:iron chelate uptake ABC transporter family permease subunit [Chitinophagales bacterium]